MKPSHRDGFIDFGPPQSLDCLSDLSCAIDYKLKMKEEPRKIDQGMASACISDERRTNRKLNLPTVGNNSIVENPTVLIGTSAEQGLSGQITTMLEKLFPKKTSPLLKKTIRQSCQKQEPKLNSGDVEREENKEDMSIDASKQSDEIEQALGAANTLGKKAGRSNFPDIVGGLDELNMDNYDDDDDSVASLWMYGKAKQKVMVCVLNSEL
ncbi:hypothetical protein SSX86_030105 [Deinandra increscens subsp. villosa]|uniref:Uncharacterized protein n=1 Tax=Deinandra increscens subsp. villosa TaxID=3103831 RepID=A0AAP0CBE2_9ASTR